MIRETRQASFTRTAGTSGLPSGESVVDVSPAEDFRSVRMKAGDKLVVNVPANSERHVWHATKNIGTLLEDRFVADGPGGGVHRFAWRTPDVAGNHELYLGSTLHDQPIVGPGYCLDLDVELV